MTQGQRFFPLQCSPPPTTTSCGSIRRHKMQRSSAFLSRHIASYSHDTHQPHPNMANPTTKTIAFNNANVVYDAYGIGSTALLFIHGWCCNAKMWSAQHPLLDRYRSIVVDVPGHGRSDAPLDYDYSGENFANAAHACVLNEGVETVVLVGHSMGVIISSMFLRLHSDMVLGLMMVDGPFMPPHCEQSKAQRDASIPFYSDDEQFRVQFAATLGPQLSSEQKEWILDTMVGSPKHMRLNAVTDATLFHSWAWKEVFDVPATRYYQLFGPADPRWKHHLPRLVDERWEGHGHWLQLEDPERFNKALVSFIEEHDLIQPN